MGTAGENPAHRFEVIREGLDADRYFRMVWIVIVLFVPEVDLQAKPFPTAFRHDGGQCRDSFSHYLSLPVSVPKTDPDSPDQGQSLPHRLFL